MFLESLPGRHSCRALSRLWPAPAQSTAAGQPIHVVKLN
jgi:hypothetical protein